MLAASLFLSSRPARTSESVLRSLPTMGENGGSCSHATPPSLRAQIGRSWNGRRTIAAMQLCRVTLGSTHGRHKAAVVPQKPTTTCLLLSRVQAARVLVGGSGRQGTRAMMSTTSEEARRLSSSPSYLGQTRELPVRQDKRQSPSCLASISGLQQEQRQHPLRRAPRRAPRQGAVLVVAADSKQIVGIVERMALDGAISLLPIAPSALAPSTPAGRHQSAVGGRHRRRQLHRHLQHQRRRQGAPMAVSIAQIGPPVENVRATPASC